ADRPPAPTVEEQLSGQQPHPAAAVMAPTTVGAVDATRVAPGGLAPTASPGRGPLWLALAAVALVLAGMAIRSSGGDGGDLAPLSTTSTVATSTSSTPQSTAPPSDRGTGAICADLEEQKRALDAEQRRP